MRERTPLTDSDSRLQDLPPCHEKSSEGDRLDRIRSACRTRRSSRAISDALPLAAAEGIEDSGAASAEAHDIEPLRDPLAPGRNGAMRDAPAIGDDAPTSMRGVQARSDPNTPQVASQRI